MLMEAGSFILSIRSLTDIKRIPWVQDFIRIPRGRELPTLTSAIIFNFGVLCSLIVFLHYETVTSVQKYCNPGVKIRGILFTRFNPRANISRQIKELAEQLSEYISAPIYKTYIRAAVAVEEAQANRSDIFNYAGKSTVADDYRAFIEEFLKGADA